MKKAVFLLIILSAVAVCGQVSVGLMLTNHFNASSNKADTPNATTSSGTQFDLSLGPVVRILVSSSAEVVPYIGFMVDNRSVKDQNGQTTTSGNGGMFFGCGLYFFVLSNSNLKFSLGPRVSSEFWFSHTDVTFGVGMPLNFDFELGGPWSLRASASVIDFLYTHNKTGNNVTNGFSYSLSSIFSPEITFFVTF
jgi:hypothetical protein